MDIILWPFAQLLRFLNTTTGSYALAIFLFALIVKVILFPFSLKGKRSMIQMNMLSGKMQKLQKQYGKDQQRYNEELQKLYAKEKVNPMSGCLWSFIPLLILIPLYGVIRQPLHHMMGMSLTAIAELADNFFHWQTVAVENGWVSADAMAKLVEQLSAGDITNLFQTGAYNEMFLSSLINSSNLEAVKAAAGEAGQRLFAINFNMLGLDLAAVPNWKFWDGGISWQSVGLFLLPVISAALSFLFSKITNLTNAINNPDAAQAANNGTMKGMLIMMPLMSLWIGFSMPAGLCVYWIANSVLGMAQEYISALMLKKDYEAARAAQEEQERLEKEEEKARRRAAAERRAIEAEENRKNKNKKKVKESAGGPSAGEVASLSRVGMRTYARGRAYDPDRFGGVTPYYDPDGHQADDRSHLDKKYDELEKDAEEKLTEQPAVEEQTPAVDTAPEETIPAVDAVQAEAPYAPESEEAPSEDEESKA